MKNVFCLDGIEHDDATVDTLNISSARNILGKIQSNDSINIHCSNKNRLPYIYKTFIRYK